MQAIRFRMEQLGLDRKALEPAIGSRARVSEVLSRKRRPTLDRIRRLHEQLGIPAEHAVCLGAAIHAAQLQYQRSATTLQARDD